MRPEISYRDYWIQYNPKPIPTDAWDWDWWHKDYDGPEDRRSGAERSLGAAKDAIDEMEEDIADELESRSHDAR